MQDIDSSFSWLGMIDFSLNFMSLLLYYDGITIIPHSSIQKIIILTGIDTFPSIFYNT